MPPYRIIASRQLARERASDVNNPNTIPWNIENGWFLPMSKPTNYLKLLGTGYLISARIRGTRGAIGNCITCTRRTQILDSISALRT